MTAHTLAWVKKILIKWLQWGGGHITSQQLFEMVYLSGILINCNLLRKKTQQISVVEYEKQHSKKRTGIEQEIVYYLNGIPFWGKWKQDWKSAITVHNTRTVPFFKIEYLKLCDTKSNLYMYMFQAVG